MIIYDISMTIAPGMPVYGGNASRQPIIKVDRNFQTSTAYETRADINMHTGTHIDAPLHMIPGGDTMDELDLTKTVTPCKVLDFCHVNEKITARDLISKSERLAPGDFILLKTQNSFLEILETEFVYLDKTGAEYLAKAGIAGVGIDALGVERTQPGHDTHKLLFGAGMVILEGLRLKEVDEGDYLLIAAPLKIGGAEAAPARAFLISAPNFANL